MTRLNRVVNPLEGVTSSVELTSQAFPEEPNDGADGLTPYEQAQVDSDVLLAGDEAIRNLSPYRIMEACKHVMITYTNLLRSMFENARRFGKDAPEGFLVLPFNSEYEIAPGARYRIQSTPQIVFKGLFLLVDENCADHFDIDNFIIGVMSQFINIEPVRASAFKRAYCFLKLDVLQISQSATLTVHNTSDRARRFGATLYGVTTPDYQPVKFNIGPQPQRVFSPERVTTSDRTSENAIAQLAAGILSIEDVRDRMAEVVESIERGDDE